MSIDYPHKICYPPRTSTCGNRATPGMAAETTSGMMQRVAGKRNNTDYGNLGISMADMPPLGASPSQARRRTTAPWRLAGRQRSFDFDGEGA